MGQKSRNHSITNATFCLAQPKQVNKHGVEKYIWQLKHILGLSFGQQNIFDNQNKLSRYYQIKVR